MPAIPVATGNFYLSPHFDHAAMPAIAEKLKEPTHFNLLLPSGMRAQLEAFRKQEGHRSIGEAVRELIARGLTEVETSL